MKGGGDAVGDFSSLEMTTNRNTVRCGEEIPLVAALPTA
jgi:hypothetical protein